MTISSQCYKSVVVTHYDHGLVQEVSVLDATIVVAPSVRQLALWASNVNDESELADLADAVLDLNLDSLDNDNDGFVQGFNWSNRHFIMVAPCRDLETLIHESVHLGQQIADYAIKAGEYTFFTDFFGATGVFETTFTEEHRRELEAYVASRIVSCLIAEGWLEG